MIHRLVDMPVYNVEVRTNSTTQDLFVKEFNSTSLSNLLICLPKKKITRTKYLFITLMIHVAHQGTAKKYSRQLIQTLINEPWT
jgi:hypothetical protein